MGYKNKYWTTYSLMLHLMVVILLYQSESDAEVPGYTHLTNTHIRGLNLEVYSGISLFDCAERCNTYWASYNPYSCVSFDYDKNTRTCYLSDRTSENLPGEYWGLVMGINHYERDAISICDIPKEDYRICTTYDYSGGWSMTREKCLQMGCCWKRYTCFKSRATVPEVIPCDQTCQSVIRSVEKIDDENYHETFLEESIREAKMLIPKIPESFWDWLHANIVIKEAIFAVKWPIEPRLIENLYELVDGFGKNMTEQYPHLFVGVAYAMISVGVKTRMNIDYYPQSEAFMPNGVAEIEGLDESTIEAMKKEEDAAAKAALNKTAEDEKEEFLEIRAKQDTCLNGHSQNWVRLYKQGDKKSINCHYYLRGFTNIYNIEDCQKKACDLRGNAMNYVNGHCYIYYCYKGELKLGTASVDVWIYRKQIPDNCQMVTHSSHGEQIHGEFKRMTRNNEELCSTECMDRAACLSFTYDNSNNRCHLYNGIFDLIREDSSRYTHKKKNCANSIEECVPRKILTYGGNGTGDHCVFPFTSTSGQNHTQCTSEGADKAWCATTDDYPSDLSWGYCEMTTFGGSANGANCHFAYRYIKACTKVRYFTYWCYTDPNGSRWGKCNMAGYDCTFPADDPNNDNINKRFNKLHDISENKKSNCYKWMLTKPMTDVDSCLSFAVVKKANIAQYKNGQCELRLCYTSNLVIKSTAHGHGYHIYRDMTLIFDEGNPISTWDNREHVSYIHGDIWSDFSSKWATKCGVSSPDDLQFPPRDARMNGFDLIQHIITKNYTFWDFPILSAPWPLVSMAWPESSKRECQFVWNIVYSNINPIFYSKYTYHYQHINVQCRKSKWYPDKTIPRIIEDGGVCGRQSYLEEQSRRCLGQPSVGVSQPGHRALFYYRYLESNIVHPNEPLCGPYRLFTRQTITSSNFYTTSLDRERTLLTPTGGDVLSIKYTKMSIEYYSGIAASINKDLDSFTKGSIMMALHNRAPDDELKHTTLNLIAKVLITNPYLVHVWHYFLDQVSGFDTHWKSDSPLAFNNIFATKCPNETVYTSKKSQLWDLAKTYLRREIMDHGQVTGFPVTYAHIALRFYAPAPCCVNETEAAIIISELHDEINNFNMYFSDKNNYLENERLFEQNIALCKAYAGRDWNDTLSSMQDNIEKSSKMNGAIWGKGRMSAVTSFIDRLILVKGGDVKISKSNIIDYIQEHIFYYIPHITVTSSSWIVSQEFDVIAKYLISLYNDIGNTTARSEVQTYLAELVDRKYGDDLTWWQEMNEKGLLKGDYEAILDGTVVWQTDKFVSVSKRDGIVTKKSTNEKQARERELFLYGGL